MSVPGSTTSSIARSVALVVPGRPIPLERARKGPNGFYLPEPSRDFRDLVQAEWMIAGRPRLEGPLLVSAIFYFLRPKSHVDAEGRIRRRFEGALPPGDTDNLVKAVLDALQDQGGVPLMYGDDRQVVTVFAARRWAYGGELERTLIEARAAQAL